MESVDCVDFGFVGGVNDVDGVDVTHMYSLTQSVDFFTDQFPSSILSSLNWGTEDTTSGREVDHKYG